MNMKQFLKKKLHTSFMMAFAVMIIAGFCSFNVHATAETSSSVMIDVRVKADVPQNFSGTITLNYVGRETDGFTVILTPEDEYSTLVSIPQDLYTFKNENVPDGFMIKASKNFTLENTELNTVYLLPIIVSEQTTMTNETASYINVKVVAEPQNEAELNGTYDVSFSGTGGNSFIASLCAENDYTVEMPISKDVYTLKELNVSSDYKDAYVLDTLYSFNTVDANGDEKYLLSVKVYNKADAPVKEEKEEKIVKEISVFAKLPTGIDFAGTITATYQGENNSSFEAVLNESNGYKQSLYVPLDTYTLSYAVSYDTKVYSFTGQPSFIVTESTDFMEVPVYIMKDGVVLTDENMNESAEGEQNADVADSGNKQSTPTFIIIIVILIIGVAGFFIYKKFIASKNDHSDDEDDEDGNAENEFEEDKE